MHRGSTGVPFDELVCDECGDPLDRNDGVPLCFSCSESLDYLYLAEYFDQYLCPLCDKGPEADHRACNKAIEEGVD